MKYKILNGLCVPVSTPDDYLEQSARKWLQNLRLLVAASKSQQRQNQQREEARNEFQAQN